MVKFNGSCIGVSAAQVTVLNAVATKLPFLPADEDTVVSEEVRLRTRVLDLRCALLPFCQKTPARCKCSSRALNMRARQIWNLCSLIRMSTHHGLQ
jgi:aspartyl-tRNA synthetase